LSVEGSVKIAQKDMAIGGPIKLKQSQAQHIDFLNFSVLIS